MIPAELFVAVVLYGLGVIVFGHFTAETPILGRVLKFLVFVGLVAAVSLSASRWWSWLLVAGTFTVAIGVHCWWCVRHGIHPVTAEPRDRYRRLRGLA